jgi:DNA-binding NtrC family response regulator
VRKLLGEDSVDVSAVGGGEAGIHAAVEAESEGSPFDVVLLDYYMPGTGGVEVLSELNGRGVDARVIIMSGREPGEVAVEAMRLGAFDFISKPLNRAELRMRVERALRDRRAGLPQTPGNDKESEKEAKRRPRKSDVIIGGGPWIKELY